MPDGKWRLGNEEDTKIELIPQVTLKSIQELWQKFRPTLPIRANVPLTGTAGRRWP
jgi:hypothetical protein